MISRRFLLSAAPCALVAASLPNTPMASIGEYGPELVGSTWGAGTSAAMDSAMLPSITAWMQVQNGLMTIAEVRAAEEMPAPTFDLEGLLRGKP